jgi:hypothetical protein
VNTQWLFNPVNPLIGGIGVQTMGGTMRLVLHSTNTKQVVLIVVVHVPVVSVVTVAAWQGGKAAKA